MYEYRGEIQRVVDGDTVHARIDLGCDIRTDLTLRLAGINAPEMGTAAGQAARVWLLERLTTPAGPRPTVMIEAKFLSIPVPHRDRPAVLHLFGTAVVHCDHAFADQVMIHFRHGDEWHSRNLATVESIDWLNDCNAIVYGR